MFRRTAFLTAAGLVIALTVATPAQAAGGRAAAVTTTVNATIVPETPCNDAGVWRFSIGGVGGSSGIASPASIVAAIKGGGTATVPLKSESGDPSQFATYELATPATLTGAATAEIDTVWTTLLFPFFQLSSGPCAESHVTISTNGTFFVQGATIIVTVHISGATGPLAGQHVTLRHHSLELTGKGETLGPFTTAADGSFTHDIPATTLGYHDVAAEYNGSSVFDQARQSAYSDPIELNVVPAAPPASPNGVLASSAGPTSRTTTVSGAGFLPQTPVTITAYSTPTLLKVVLADDDGKFSAPVTLPDSLVGEHTIVAQGAGQDPEGELVTRNLTLKVNLPPGANQPGGNQPGGNQPGANPPPAAGLPQTGQSLTMILLLGGGLVLAGFALWFAASRRKTRSA